jgi:electron transfer flavoprotein alpha subunit
VANVLVAVELVGAHALPVCLEVLGQARRLGTRLGATVYAVLPLERAPSYGEDDVIAELSRHGADKVVVVTDEALAEGRPAMRWDTHGAALASVNELLPASLFLFGATAGAREVAARLAARMGAAFLADAWVELGEDRLTLWDGSGAAARALALDGTLEFPVVATVPPGRYRMAAGDEEAEVEVVAATGRTPGGFARIDEEAAPAATVRGGEGEAAARLAHALGAAEGVPTPLAVSLGPRFDAPLAEARVALGDGAALAEAHYAVEGAPDALADELARLVGGSG